MSHAGSEETKQFADERSRADQTRLQSTTPGKLAAAFRSDTQDFQAAGLLPFPELPDCKVIGVLGRGGMGIVYKALQTQLNREVAVKTILATIADSPMVVARFFTEAEAMAAVQHPHVAQVFGFGEAKGTPYLVMELLTGGTLSNRLAEQKTLPPEPAVRLIEKVARAVGVVHDRNIVHRDLKPGNVMFDEHGEPKLTDFGLAKRADSNLTVTDLQMGTPYYMAPEQADGKAKFVGPQADVWALGVILYECLTGVRPFEGANSPSVVHQVIHGDVKPLRKVSAKLPRDLETICQKCLHKDPASRYANGADLADDLNRWLNGEPIEARRTPPAERLILWARRKPMHALAWVLVPLTLLLIGFGVVLYQMWREAEEATRDAVLAKEQLALFSNIRQRTNHPMPGGTWDTQADLAAFARLRPDAETVTNLRTDAVAALTGLDFREVKPLTTDFAVGAVAASPDGRTIAVGQFKPGMWVAPVPIHLYDPKGTEFRTVWYSPGLVANKPVQDSLVYLAFSQDGKHLFAGTKSGNVHHWDLSNPKAEPAHCWRAEREIRSLAVAADATAVFTLTTRGTVQKWTFANDKPAAVHKTDNVYGALAVQPTTGDLFAGLGSELAVLDPITLKPKATRTFGPHAFHRLRFGPTGEWLLASAGGTLQVVDAATRKPTFAFLDPALRTEAHRGKIAHLELHPSGAVAFSLSDDTADHTLKVWDVPAGKLVGSVALPGEGQMSLALSADGGTVIVGTALRTHRFELRGLELIARHVHHAGPTEAATWLPSGSGVTALTRQPDADGDPKRSYALSAAVGPKRIDYRLSVPRIGEGRPGLAAHGDAVAVTTWQNDLLIWTATEPAKLQTRPLHSPLLPRFQPDGRLWVVEDDLELRRGDLADGRPKWSNKLQNFLTGAAGIQALAVGPTTLAAGTREGAVVVLDANAAVKKRYATADGPVTSLALARDESLAVAGLYAGKVRTIRLADDVEEEPLAAHRDTVSAIALGGGYLATGSHDRSVRLFLRADGGWRPLFTFNDLGAGVTVLEFSPDGRRLLIACENCVGYRVLDVEKLHAELTKVGFGW